MSCYESPHFTPSLLLLLYKLNIFSGISIPLLKLRPRKDLVETLLHEMIHAYLFVTDNNDNHDGHGPEFHKHMYRINKATGNKSLFYLQSGILIRFLSDHLENSEQFPLYHNNHCPTDNQPYDCKTFG